MIKLCLKDTESKENDKLSANPLTDIYKKTAKGTDLLRREIYSSTKDLPLLIRLLAVVPLVAAYVVAKPLIEVGVFARNMLARAKGELAIHKNKMVIKDMSDQIALQVENRLSDISKMTDIDKKIAALQALKEHVVKKSVKNNLQIRERYALSTAQKLIGGILSDLEGKQKSSAQLDKMTKTTLDRVGLSNLSSNKNKQARRASSRQKL